ncbi:unnamed protein product [Ixodes hexagonus]
MFRENARPQEITHPFFWLNICNIKILKDRPPPDSRRRSRDVRRESHQPRFAVPARLASEFVADTCVFVCNLRARSQFHTSWSRAYIAL